MNSLKSCPPDYSQFSIDQYEVAYQGLSLIASVVDGVVCQPRAIKLNGRLAAGAALVQRHGDGSDEALEDMIAHLRSIRFPVDDDEDRRLRLIARYDLEHDRPFEAIVQDVARGLAAA